jgi:hypothetical protein
MEDEDKTIEHQHPKPSTGKNHTTSMQQKTQVKSPFICRKSQTYLKETDYVFPSETELCSPTSLLLN